MRSGRRRRASPRARRTSHVTPRRNERAEVDIGRVDPIDFLFTVVITIGLTPELLGSNFDGLLSERWAREGALPSYPREVEHLLAFSVGLLTLTLSWYGYHGSATRMWMHYSPLEGLMRFQTQLFMVVIYGLMMIRFDCTILVMSALSGVFFLYVAWDSVAVRDAIQEDQILSATYQTIGQKLGYLLMKRGFLASKFRRQLVTVFWFILTVILLLLSLFVHDVLILIGAVLVVILYRVNKEQEWGWERWLRRLFKVQDSSQQLSDAAEVPPGDSENDNTAGGVSSNG